MPHVRKAVAILLLLSNHLVPMATYVDGFVLTVPKDKRAAYKKMAREGAKVWKQFGALEYKECRAEDMSPQHVSFTFPKMAKAKENEEVWFSFIGSKLTRDSIRTYK